MACAAGRPPTHVTLPVVPLSSIEKSPELDEGGTRLVHKQQQQHKRKQGHASKRLNSDVMGGFVDTSWFSAGSDMSEISPVILARQSNKWPHEAEGVQIPMPKPAQMHRMKSEFYQRCKGQPVGPECARWRQQVFAWAERLKRRFFEDPSQVTGLWSLAEKRWLVRLKRVCDRVKCKRIHQEVRDGARLPFSSRPPGVLHAKSNHKDLGSRAHDVFKAICAQLDQGSVQPFDASAGKRPRGIFALRWVAKSDPSKIRLTLNGIPINVFFASKDCTIDLQTHAQLRRKYAPNHMFLGFDLKDGFFNQQYCEQDRSWVGFRISADELGEELAAMLRQKVPEAWSCGYFYFVYRGLVMGLGPSCQQLQRVVEALVDVWTKCEVRGISWGGTNYIDDIMAMALGTFEGAIELSLRLLAELIVLGFSVNLNEKSTIVPTYFYCHIGICINSCRMRFSLPARRAAKMKLCACELQAAAKIGSKVNAKLVARFIGQLWSAHIVCYRAVAIMARAMIHTIAVLIRRSGVADETDLHKLKYLLKKVWGGQVTWTAEAQSELDFWLGVDFATLSAPISHDALSAKLENWIASPVTGELAKEVKVFAVDTSNSMSGGGEFIRDGELWCMRGKMAVRLTPQEVLTSSTLRELLGVCRLDLALIPDSCRKVLLPLDSQAAVQCLLKGSKVPELQKVCAQIFLNQLRHNRILWPVWMRRCEFIIRMCDDTSRLTDKHAFTMEPAIFWKANGFAEKLWGKGFQIDVCADMHNVQPVDSAVRLPFFSRWSSPYSSGVDMLQQSWRRRVCWCNAPFALLPRVFALLRAQKACAAVVVPLGTKANYGSMVGAKNQGIRYAFTFRPSRACWSPKSSSLSVFSNDYAVLFVDFRERAPCAFVDDPVAVRRGPCDPPVYRRVPSS